MLQSTATNAVQGQPQRQPAAPGANPMASALRGGQTQAGMSGQGLLNAGPSLNQYAGQGIQTSLNTRSLGAMPTADDAGRQRIEGALFDRMRPEHQQQQEALEGKLSRMGLARGTEAWNRELQRSGDQQARERFNALEMGGNEQQRLFGMQLQGRQQGWNELLGAGQFANQAQQQGFGQREAGISGDFSRAQQAGNQNYNQGLQTATFNNNLRRDAITEERNRRREGLEDYNLMTGGVPRVTDPTFNNGPTGRPTGAIDYTAAGTAGYAGDTDAFNYRQGVNSSLWNGFNGVMNAGGYGGYGQQPGYGAPMGGYNQPPQYPNMIPGGDPNLIPGYFS
jgi:hypothetical protein